MCKVHSPIGNTEDITEKPAEITDPANAKAILNVSVLLTWSLKIHELSSKDIIIQSTVHNRHLFKLEMYNKFHSL